MQAGTDMTRRDLLAGSVAAVIGTSIAGLRGQAAWAASGIHALKLGTLQITVLSDGVLNVATRLLNRDMPAEAIETALGGALSAPGQVQYSANVVVVRNGGELVLIDAGSGTNWEPTVGKLADRLTEAGIDPAQITKVVITHGHPDHIWGLVDDFDDGLRFPNAEHIMPAAELDYWRNVDTAALPERMQGVSTGAKRVIGKIGERLRAAEPDKEILPGVSYIATPGHTPGHCSVRLTSGADNLIVTADTVFHPHVSFANPDWQPVADMDGGQAVASRRRLLDMAATDRIPLLAYHIPFPGFGRVERHDSAYRWRTT
jgi:glyoxylase-like metal-dependent hydrolase (beta-lactamase superfamily II)